jgi:nicotinic acid mononucleotide adenylyltransferase
VTSNGLIIIGIMSCFGTGTLARATDLADKRVLIASGSYDPPHKGHMSLLLDAIDRFGFSNAVVSVGYPYKGGASSPEKTLGLTRTAIEELQEVMTTRGMSFSDFRLKGPGSVSWTSGTGKTVHVRVVDNEHRLGKQRALSAFKETQKELGIGPTQTFYLVGADSLTNLKSRSHESLDEWLSSSTWLVSMRRSENGALIDLTSTNPLKEALAPGLAGRYGQPTRKGAEVWYSGAHGTQLVLFSPEGVPDISSTQIRDAIKNGRVEEAALYLQSGIVRKLLPDPRCLKTSVEQLR